LFSKKNASEEEGAREFFLTKPLLKKETQNLNYQWDSTVALSVHHYICSVFNEQLFEWSFFEQCALIVCLCIYLCLCSLAQEVVKVDCVFISVAQEMDKEV